MANSFPGRALSVGSLPPRARPCSSRHGRRSGSNRNSVHRRSESAFTMARSMHFFHLDALSSDVPLKGEIGLQLPLLGGTLYRLLAEQIGRGPEYVTLGKMYALWIAEAEGDESMATRLDEVRGAPKRKFPRPDVLVTSANVPRLPLRSLPATQAARSVLSPRGLPLMQARVRLDVVCPRFRAPRLARGPGRSPRGLQVRLRTRSCILSYVSLAGHWLRRFLLGPPTDSVLARVSDSVPSEDATPTCSFLGVSNSLAPRIETACRHRTHRLSLA